MIPAEEYERPKTRDPGYTILPDIQPFVSPVDGKVILGRRSLREHNRRHRVTNSADFKETWKQQAKERENRIRSQRSDRIEAIKHAIEAQGKRR